MRTITMKTEFINENILAKGKKQRNRFALSNEHPNTIIGKTVDYDIQNFGTIESQMEKHNKKWHHLTVYSSERKK